MKLCGYVPMKPEKDCGVLSSNCDILRRAAALCAALHKALIECVERYNLEIKAK